MPRLISEITEIVTGLGMTGAERVEDALESRPAALLAVDDSTWGRVRDAYHDRTMRPVFLGAFANGRAFLRADDGLRDRLPLRVEWRGSARTPTDDQVPADLRIDHVYLVSCKYVSKILHNASPASLFERCLASSQRRTTDTDWFATVAPAPFQQLYREARLSIDGGVRFPERVGDLDQPQRRELSKALAAGWTPAGDARYRELSNAVSAESARRWNEALATAAERRLMLWRLLRIGSAPYFVLGTGAGDTLRLRVMTPWDWNQAFELVDFAITAEEMGQPRVRWEAEVRQRSHGPDRSDRSVRSVRGHIEIRWSHGRFGGRPEAKVYLDTAHRDVPGYEPLTTPIDTSANVA